MRAVLVACLLFSMLALSTTRAAAQELEGFALNRFEPAPAGDRFFAVQGNDPGGHLKPRAMLLGEYAYRPLVLYVQDGDERVGSVVSDQLFLHGSFAIGLWQRLLLSLDLPLALVNEGQSPAAGGVTIGSPSGAAVGDLRLGARARVLGEARSILQLGVAGYLWLPTGDEEQLTSDGQVRGLPALVVSGENDSVAYAVTTGVGVRGERRFAATSLGSELSFGAGVAALVADRTLQVGPELYGTTTLADAFERDTLNLEALLGAKLRVGKLVFGAGAGPGITRGLGTPTLRAVASVTYAEAGPDQVSDRDRDGVADDSDACPDVAGVASSDPARNGCPADRDGDGVLDGDDACVDVAGVQSDDPKQNGCPPDRDRDGILDADDACVDLAGVKHEDPKKNGCPPDRDGDGVYDVDDACVDVVGVKSDDAARNGCPPDTDGDTIIDPEDACPREKGKPDADPSKNGCPGLVRVLDTEIQILQQVQFKTASDVILPASDELLTQVAEVLREHPEITQIEVQGHTDNRGGAAYNKKLSHRRAISVMNWLIEKGQLDMTRLVASGYGMDQPIAPNTTEEGRQMNRRVAFKILQQNREQTPANPVSE